MSPTTSSAIETFLFEKGGWVSSEFLQSHFDVSDRGLRRALAGVAAAGDRGYIHSYYATRDDVETYCGPKVGHAVTELKNVKRLRMNHRNRYRPAGIAPEAALVQPELLS